MNYYSRDEVYEKTLKYFKGDTLATDVWINKYALKDSDDKIYEQTPDDMHKRIAKELARIEGKYPNPIKEDEIFDMIKDFKYIVPQGSPMSGIGNNKQVVSLSNCFVIGNEDDSYGGIFLTDQEQAQLMKRRGGVGHDLSHIRPKGSKVNNSALTSTGIVPFMDRYSNTTREVAQDGRRGALMLSISVKHPDSEHFIDAKIDTTKVTGANVSVRIGDDFMKAIEKSEDYLQQFPIDSDKPLFTKLVKPKKIWDKIIHNAWKSAEPGVLFWDTIIKESVADSYPEHGFKTVSTNPCIVGDTLIAVADGRNAVSIKQLTDEGKDIPVYSTNSEGKIVIRTMRNPRITGYNQQIYKVNIEGGHSFRVTGNHKIRLKDGKYVEAKDLKYGDSLQLMTKYKASLKDIFPNANSRSSDYMWINNGDYKTNISEHRLIYEQLNDIRIEPGNVIHHKDFNSLNNNINNLQLMDKKEHDKYHGECIRGDKNPYHRMSNEWKYNFASHKGESNSKYIEVSNDEIIEHAKLLTKKLDRRFSNNDWIEYAKENNLPQFFSNYRRKLIGNVLILSKRVALELGYDKIDEDPRLVKTYEESLNNGYDTEIINNEVVITKICEKCGNEFNVNYFKREISFCSHSCSLDYINNDKGINKKRINTLNDTYRKKGEKTKSKQVKILSNLKFKSNRNPLLKEWEMECKNSGIPFRLKTKYGFQNYKEIIDSTEMYNHKVLSVELDGHEDVYNGTVDEFHNFYSGGFEEKTNNGKSKYLYINQLQCGEITLCPYDSCRLVALNLYSFVDEPFTKNAKFNWDKFIKYTINAQRFMDDIIDLELEKIDRIIEKIKSDPETEATKLVEMQLWEKIKDKAINGRRTGLGVTAEGDMLASLGLTYGTKDATKFSVKIHKTLAINAYKSSAIMANERGSFPIYDYEKENGSEFIKRIRKADPELDEMLKKGRRNISILTIAPTGSVSICTQTTSGIEPVFMPAYKRRRKINPNDKGSVSHFIDENGDHWEEYTILHLKFSYWLELNGYDIEEFKVMKQDEMNKIIEKSPYYKASSDDIDWNEKVKMQGEVQKWVDHSISVTINLPSNTTVEIVDELYRTAWKSGCKGVTVYRDGSRDGVMIKNNGSEKTIDDYLKENNAPKRPKTLECEVVRFVNNKEKWIGFLGIYEQKDPDVKFPYELFTGVLESFPLPNYVEKGWIRKTKNKKTGKSQYDFIYMDKEGYEVIMTGMNRAFNREFWNTSKMISAMLRHKIHLPTIMNLVDSLQINGKGSDGYPMFGTWQAGVKRILKKYLRTSSTHETTCESCGSTNLIRLEGCPTCRDCGWSKCSS